MKNLSHSTNSLNVIIQSNSPGEVSAWVLPFIKALKELHKDIYVIIFLTPCQYASGAEFDVLRQSEDINHVYSPSETLKTLRSWPFYRKKSTKGFVMYFGGDPFYSQLLGLKFGYPVFGYTEHNQKLGLLFKKTFFKETTGNLMAENVSSFHMEPEIIRKKYKLPDKPILLIFCGSRPTHFTPFFPFMQATIEKLLETYIEYHPVFLISPFISDTLYQSLLVSSNYSVLRGSSLELMSIASCLITLPGTNNTEAMYMRLPMILVIPLNRPDLIIFDGLLGLLSQLPLIGIGLKKILISMYKRKYDYFSPANRYLNKPIIPEIIDDIEENSLAQTIKTIISNPSTLETMKTTLATIPIPQNVAKSIITTIFTILKK